MVAIRILSSLFLVLIIQSCTTVVAPPNAPVVPPKETETVQPVPPTPPIMPGRAQEPDFPALRNVIDTCEEHIREGRWEDAITTAERGLRIERRSPELYLVLARAYVATDNTNQARAFARQGLRYRNRAPESITRQLESVLDALAQ